jgi:hypothetical protein
MNLDFQVLDFELSSKLSRYEVELKENFERTLLRPISPNVDITIWVSRKLKHDSEYLKLAILSWYIGDLGILLRENILEKQYSEEYRTKIWLCCQHRSAAFEYMSLNYSDRDFYGNLLPQLVRLAKELRVRCLMPRRPRRKNRRRGYQDKGSCRPRSQWLPSSDSTLTELQNQIERERRTQRDTLDFLLGLSGCI